MWEFRDVNLQRNIKFSFEKPLEQLMGFVDISFPVYKWSKRFANYERTFPDRDEVETIKVTKSKDWLRWKSRRKNYRLSFSVFNVEQTSFVTFDTEISKTFFLFFSILICFFLFSKEILKLNARELWKTFASHFMRSHKTWANLWWQTENICRW